MGRRYLENDARFTVYRFLRAGSFKTELAEISSPFDVSRLTLEGVMLSLVHAPGRMVVKIPRKATTVTVAYGFPPGAYSGDRDRTDGATFQIEWQGDDRAVLLYSELIDPVNNPAHRKLLHFKADLPVSTSGNARLVLRTLPGATTTMDWTCWSVPEFR